MAGSKKNISLKILVAVAYLLMVFVNALAALLPINNVTPGQVSDFYANLFAPAGITFSIWGLIYILLAGYTIYQIGASPANTIVRKLILIEKVNVYFAISSLANAAWIFSWHYFIIPLSMVFMVIILLCLILIEKEINQYKRELSLKDRILIRLPFSIYFGWITIATIANATTLLVSLGWNGFGIPAMIWTVIILVIGLIIGLAAMIKNQDVAYGFVIIWAYIGILIKHASAEGFAGQYPVIIATVSACIALLLLGEIAILVSGKRRRIF